MTSRKPTSVVLWQWARRNLASDKITIITVESSRAEQIIAFLSAVLIHSGRVALSLIMSQHSRGSIWEAGEDKRRHISQEASDI